MYGKSHNLALTALVALAFVAPARAEFRPIDGVGTNSANPTWGATHEQLLRATPANYPGDGSGSTILSAPNPREVSNTVFSQTTTERSARGLSAGVWQWGQFLDHDLSLTPADATDPANVIAPAGDPNGMTLIPFSRSVHHVDGNGIRQHENEITSYIDASMVYGSDATRAAALREMSGGRLRTSAGGLLLPTDDMAGLGSLENDLGPLGGGASNFVAGDVRVNEQTGLTAMHTLFVREHNRLAGLLSTANPSWDDEQIYQTARKIVGAEVQAITYNEFLPSLLGEHAPAAADYQYSPFIDPTISTEFSTAVYRLGHSMLNENLILAQADGTEVGTLSLRDAFFNPQLVIDSPETVDQALRGLMSQAANELDTQLIDGVRNFLFAPTGGLGTDLAALNIQRGRDHGLPDYNALRVAFGLDAVESFADITTDATVQAQLAAVYADVDSIDAWVGVLAEDHLPGTSTGELMAVAMIDQFTRLRDGDAFFYLGDDLLFADEIASMIDLSTLTMNDVLVWNTGMDYSDLPDSFFIPFAVPEPTAAGLLAGLAWLAVGGSGRARRS